MSQPFSTTGGARIGWMNATWPLARLTATDSRLAVSVFLLGNFSFTPDQVLLVERYSMIPVLGWGVRIRHCRADCPERIIFWSLGTPESLLRGIENSGFVPAAPGDAVPRGRGIAFRWPAIIAAVVVWNVLLLVDFARSGFQPAQPGPLTLVALVLAFVMSLATLISPTVQNLVLKPGRSVGAVRPLLRLLVLVTGLMAAMFASMMVGS